MVIGVSGKSGSGKSTVSRYIAKEYNLVWVDVDNLAKDIRNKYKKEIVGMLDENILIDDEIDSKKLGEILFDDEELMKRYNKFMYEKLSVEIQSIIDKKDCVIDTMFLPLMDVFKKIDIKILLKSDDETRKNRIMKRDKIDEVYFNKRDKFSLSYDENEFDLVIDTNKEYKILVKKLLDARI